jgi:hypothetical protein
MKKYGAIWNYVLIIPLVICVITTTVEGERLYDTKI